MQLWLVRHAVAEELSSAIGSDFNRPLTNKGRKRFRQLVAALVERDRPPGEILTSPLVRAVQTADILREAADLKPGQVVQEPLLAPGVALPALIGALRARDPVRVAALVGHEPDLSGILRELVGGGRFDFGKGSIACVEFPDGPATGGGSLRWFVRPGLAD